MNHTQAHVAGKHALEDYTKTLDQEVGMFGIRAVLVERMFDNQFRKRFQLDQAAYAVWRTNKCGETLRISRALTVGYTKTLTRKRECRTTLR
jgi:NAD(P)-dependent dehydrogenase (short-subunit alcohol dehydrogenase family)